MNERTFSQIGTFAANDAAVKFLTDAGFSVGIMQGPAPRGIMFGAYIVAKWRNLSRDEIKALHGAMFGDMRNGPVRISLSACAPDEARAAFKAAPAEAAS